MIIWENLFNEEYTFEEIKNKTNDLYDGWVNMAEKYSKISTITLISGYDDRKIREPGTFVPRKTGDFY